MVQAHLQLDGGWQGGLHQADEVAEQQVQRHHLGLAAAATAEGEHLLDQVAGLLRRALHPAQVLVQALIAALLRQFLGHHGVAQHAGQQVVEVVGNAPGQVPDGLHPLGLAQLLLQACALFFGLGAFGDVTQVADKARPLVARHLGQRQFGGELVAVGALGHHLHALAEESAVAGHQVMLQGAFVGLAKAWRDDQLE
ncbi:hypothetical protein D9M71_552100 [compost metagenome]